MVQLLGGSYPSESTRAVFFGKSKLVNRPRRTKKPATQETSLVAWAKPAEAPSTKTSPPGVAARPGIAWPAELATAWETSWAWAVGIPRASSSLDTELPKPMSKVVPKMAVPMAAPTCREVDCTALAWPESTTGTSDSTTPVNWAVAKPTPIP